MARCPTMSGTFASLFLGKRQDLRGKLARYVAVERNNVRVSTKP